VDFFINYKNMKNLNEDIDFINSLKEMQKSALAIFPNDNFSLEQAARAYFFLKFMDQKNEYGLEKYMSKCSQCGGENKFYGK
jgi:hypothetical protein